MGADRNVYTLRECPYYSPRNTLETIAKAEGKKVAFQQINAALQSRDVQNYARIKIKRLVGAAVELELDALKKRAAVLLEGQLGVAVKEKVEAEFKKILPDSDATAKYMTKIGFKVFKEALAKAYGIKIQGPFESEGGLDL
jgi:hypothetical protein